MDGGDTYVPRAPAVISQTGSPVPGPSAYPSAKPAAYETPNPFGERPAANGPIGRARKRIGSAAAAVIALIAKFFAAIKALFLLLPNIKLVTTLGTAMVSVVLYSLFWGWTFAIGFVVLLFIHEMGHVIQLRREGVPASAPMFVPLMGAVVMMKSMPDDALAEARVGLAGPVLGTLGAGVCFAIAKATHSEMLSALAYIGFLINLINLVPMTPFDGGRAMAAMAPGLWFVGLGLMVALLLLTGNPFLLIFIVLGAMDTHRRWKLRGTRSLEQSAYYRVSPRNRLLVGAVYLGLVALLVAGMHESQILVSGGHSFAIN
jgi:Zn-dependent protease